MSCLNFLQNHTSTDCLLACLYALVLGSDRVKSISVVEEFMDMFLEDLLGLSPRKEIEFAIELVPNTKPIFIAPY